MNDYYGTKFREHKYKQVVNQDNTVFRDNNLRVIEPSNFKLASEQCLRYADVSLGVEVELVSDEVVGRIDQDFDEVVIVLQRRCNLHVLFGDRDLQELTVLTSGRNRHPDRRSQVIGIGNEPQRFQVNCRIYRALLELLI